MGRTLWRRYGTSIIMTGPDGRLWYCEHCPCAPCLEAIEQRQKAKGITAAWSSGSPTDVTRLIDTTGATSYTLDQLKAYVNALCAGASGCFIAGPYSGGASAPTWLANTYANSATTVDELCALVAAMVYTRRAVTLSSHDRLSQFTDTVEPLSWADAWAGAVAAWPGWSATTEATRAEGWKDGYASYSYKVRLHRAKNELSCALSTEIDSTLTFWAQVKKPDTGENIVSVFDAESLGYIEDEYNAAATTAKAATSPRTATVNDSADIPPEPAGPPDPPRLNYKKGWRHVWASEFAVIEWDFTA